MTRYGIVETDVVIAGAGPAGLAVAACLRRFGARFVLLERQAELGGTWRRNYDRLCLNTGKQHSALPLLPMPSGYPTFPTRRQMLDYLRDYARHFSVEPHYGHEVDGAWRGRGGWTVSTPRGRFRGRVLVVATGYQGRPRLPEIPGLDTFGGAVVHSSAFANGAAFRGQDVLVVGAGSSGGEIAQDLYEHGARPALVVRGPLHVAPREIAGRPTQELYIALRRLRPPVADRLLVPIFDRLVGDLSRFGIVRPAVGPCTDARRRGRIPLVDHGVVELIRQRRVPVLPAVARFEAREAWLVDGRRRPVDAVVLATGFECTVSRFLVEAEAALDERGVPRTSGAEAALPGLFFLGYAPYPSGSLREIARGAPRIANRIEALLGGPRAPTARA